MNRPLLAFAAAATPSAVATWLWLRLRDRIHRVPPGLDLDEYAENALSITDPDEEWREHLRALHDADELAARRERARKGLS